MGETVRAWRSLPLLDMILQCSSVFHRAISGDLAASNCATHLAVPMRFNASGGRASRSDRIKACLLSLYPWCGFDEHQERALIRGSERLCVHLLNHLRER
jgi:hypothetical protein